jgi:hypothetical protein
LDEATEAVVTHQKSLAFRSGYKPGDPVMQQMTRQLWGRYRSALDAPAVSSLSLKSERSTNVGYL